MNQLQTFHVTTDVITDTKALSHSWFPFGAQKSKQNPYLHSSDEEDEGNSLVQGKVRLLFLLNIYVQYAQKPYGSNLLLLESKYDNRKCYHLLSHYYVSSSDSVNVLSFAHLVPVTMAGGGDLRS